MPHKNNNFLIYLILLTDGLTLLLCCVDGKEYGMLKRMEITYLKIKPIYWDQTISLAENLS